MPAVRVQRFLTLICCALALVAVFSSRAEGQRRRPDTTHATPGKHTLRASVAPVAGEEDVVDNVLTATVNVKAP